MQRGEASSLHMLPHRKINNIEVCPAGMGLVRRRRLALL
jgi:hypothetical protein